MNKRQEVCIKPINYNDLTLFQILYKNRIPKNLKLDTKFDSVPRFITKKWIEVCDQSRKICNINKQIRLRTSMLQSGLCDYSDTYIIVKGTITVADPNDENYEKKLPFKNNAPFISCIT